MKHIFIINPAAGKSDKTAEYTACIRNACAGLDYEIAVSKGPGDCTRIAREAAESGREVRLYACGGDGTLNEVVAGAAGYPNAAVTVYVGGSGNDFVKIFDDREAFRELKRLLDAQTAEFDLIDMNGHLSLNICCVGLDARVGNKMSEYKRLPYVSGSGAYIMSTVANVVQGISEDRNAWHTGDGVNGPGNRKGIGVEICYSLSGGERFDKAERNAAKFLAERLYARGWDIDRVKKHQDFNGKYCPHRTLDRGWTRFLDMVQAELNALDTGFVDVPAGSWYHDAVQWALEKGITSGVDGLHFAPDEICTRAQAVTFLWRLYGSPEPESYQSFADVQPAAWYAKAVQWARQKGISEGIGGGKFGPEEPCTRAQIVTFLWNAKGQPEGTFLYAPFDDVDPMGWYCEAAAPKSTQRTAAPQLRGPSGNFHPLPSTLLLAGTCPARFCFVLWL